jgi:hypothetical protein
MASAVRNVSRAAAMVLWLRAIVLSNSAKAMAAASTAFCKQP